MNKIILKLTIMKTKKYIPLSALALVCFFAFSFVSCSKEDIPRAEEDGRGYIVAMLRNSQNGNALDGTGDNVIYSIRMLVFCNDDGTLIDQELFERDPITDWDDIDYLSMEVPLGVPLDIRMIANEKRGGAAMATALAAVSDLDDLYDIQTVPIIAPILYGDIAGTGLLMTGGADNVTVAADGSSLPVAIPLTHLTARIELRVIDGVKDPIVNLTGVTLNRAAGISYLFCNAGFTSIWEQEPINNFMWGTFFPPLLPPRIDDSWTFSMYLYENLNGMEPSGSTTLLLSFFSAGFGFSIDLVHINDHLVGSGRRLIQRGQHTTIKVSMYYPGANPPPPSPSASAATRTETTPSWTVEVSQKPMN